MEKLPAVKESMFFDVARFEHAQRVAKVFTESTMVPEIFRGSVGNTLIAMNYADRIGADLFMTMQNMCVIHGKPGVEGKLVIALVNNCGRFDPVEFEEIGDLRKPTKDEDGCIAYAKDLKSGKMLKGPLIDWAMVKAEGWFGKQGSKWKTMAPLMFRYRAATYFARTYCPEVLLGMQTREELMDVITLRQNDLGEFEPGIKNLEEVAVDLDKKPSLYGKPEKQLPAPVDHEKVKADAAAQEQEKDEPIKDDPELGSGMNEAQLYELLYRQLGVTNYDSQQNCAEYIKYCAEKTKSTVIDALRSSISNRAPFLTGMTAWQARKSDEQILEEEKRPAEPRRQGVGNPAYNGPEEGQNMDGTPKENPTTALDWDPREEPLKERYAAKFATAVKTVAEEMGIPVDGRVPKEVHADIIASNEEPPDETPPTPKNSLLERALDMRKENPDKMDAICKTMFRAQMTRTAVLHGMKGTEIQAVIDEYEKF